MFILVTCTTAMWAALLYVCSGLFLPDFGILDLSVSPTCHEHVEFSPPFITVFPHLVSSANVINIICIPASWSSSRYSVSGNIQIFFIRTGSRTDLCKTPLDVSFPCEKWIIDNYSLNSFPASLVPALIAHHVSVVWLWESPGRHYSFQDTADV